MTTRVDAAIAEAMLMLRDLSRKAVEDTQTALVTPIELATDVGGAHGAAVVLRAVLETLIRASALTYQHLVDGAPRGVEITPEARLATCLMACAYGVPRPSGENGRPTEQEGVDATVLIMKQFRAIAGSEMPLPPGWRTGL
jgi:hypothetical protein